MKIEINVSEDNESTSYPWWIIIDPVQNFNTGSRGVHNVANMITGPFFSRYAATEFLRANQFYFSKSAAVYCSSGTYSSEYVSAIRDSQLKLHGNVKR